MGILEIGAGGSIWVGSSQILSPYTAINSRGHKITCPTVNTEDAMGSANATKTGTQVILFYDNIVQQNPDSSNAYKVLQPPVNSDQIIETMFSLDLLNWYMYFLMRKMLIYFVNYLLETQDSCHSIIQALEDCKL